MPISKTGTSNPSRAADGIRKLFDGGAHFGSDEPSTNASSADRPQRPAATTSRRSVTSGHLEQPEFPDDCRSEKEAIFREALADAGTYDMRRIGVTVGDGRLVLNGRVATFYQKQLAQETVRPYAIGMEICNQIVVVGPSHESSTCQT